MTIAPERATEIQVALIKTGYLSGEPTGVWDSSTQSAMQKLQGDNGWQTKLVPDSRAIIKLGLGPNQENVSLANPTPNEARSPSASTY
ncbi:MAG: Peptidoglycan-binding domain 1 protein [Acidobacteriaceae bacterium]|nr:Peptidoglycan-binding domain 1 protein [Acidobacteriaceae bacterium]